MSITRTAIVDDDLSGTTGTVLNNAWKQELYDQIDALAAVVALATSGQLAFPATQVPSANANTLDDYEEGTWTPSLGGTATYTSRTGTYTKIGRMVHAQCQMTVNAIGTGNTGIITGLPFAATGLVAISVGYFASAVGNFVFVSGITNGSAIQITGLSAAAASISNPATFFGAGTVIYFSVSYSV